MPETKKRRRPPKRSRIFENTSLSAMRVAGARAAGRGRRFSCGESRDLAADARSPSGRSCSLRPPASSAPVSDLVVDLLEDARHRGHEGRPHDGEVLDDLVDAAVDRGGEADLQLRRPRAPCRTSATSGSQRYCTSSARRSPSLLDRLGLVDPAVVRQLDALRLAGGARGVDERGERARADRLEAALDLARMRGVPVAAERHERRERQRPAVVDATVDQDDATEIGELSPTPRSLASCASFSTKATRHPASRRMKAHSSAVFEG